MYNLLLTFLFLSVFISQVLKGSKKLSMSVCSMGRIPGGYVTNHVYTWVDPQGRSVSPPPDLHDQHSSGGRHPDVQQHGHVQQGGAEKRVSVCHFLQDDKLMLSNYNYSLWEVEIHTVWWYSSYKC